MLVLVSGAGTFRGRWVGSRRRRSFWGFALRLLRCLGKMGNTQLAVVMVLDANVT